LNPDLTFQGGWDDGILKLPFLIACLDLQMVEGPLYVGISGQEHAMKIFLASRVTGGRCCDHNSLRFFANFRRKKIDVFSQKQMLRSIFCKN
jgi:hypothetical protein